MDTNDAGFYDAIYTLNPRKWSNVDRDYLAFKILSGMFIGEPRRMLDFGCGNGHTLAFFKSQFPELACTGVDISEVALQLARQRVPPPHLFATELPPATGDWATWDVITVMGVAEHFPLPSVDLYHIGKRLEPDGYLYLEVPNCLAYSSDKSEGFRKTEAGADQMEWHFKRATWENEISCAGLEIVRSYRGASPAWEFIWVLKWKPTSTNA